MSNVECRILEFPANAVPAHAEAPSKYERSHRISQPCAPLLRSGELRVPQKKLGEKGELGEACGADLYSPPFPLYPAANPWFLKPRNWAACDHCLQRVPQILAGDGDGCAWAGVIHLAVVGQR